MLNKALVAQIRDALELAKASTTSFSDAPNALGTSVENAMRCLDALVADEECNGWTNYETWMVNLWLTNEESTFNAALNLAQCNSLEDGNLADALKDMCEADCFGDEAPANMATDLTRSALAEVNWQEIARSMAEIVNEREEA